MFCEKCGKEVNSKFCPNCGGEVKENIMSSHSNVETKIDYTPKPSRNTFLKSKKPITNVILWVVSIILFVLGLFGMIAGDIIAGVSIALLGLIFNPAIISCLVPRISFFNKIWFRCVAVVFCFVIFGATVDTTNAPTTLPVSVSSSSQSANSDALPNSATTTPVEEQTIAAPSSSSEVIDIETIKQQAQELDEKIYKNVLSAENNYNILLAAMEKADTISLFDLYDTAKSVSEAQRTISSNFSTLATKESEKYTSACGIYAYNTSEIANYIVKYIDTNEMKYLSKAKESVELNNSFILSVVAERMAYLSSQGFSDDEIVKIFEAEAATE